MKQKLILLIFLLCGTFAFAQTKEEKAYEMGFNAVKMMDEGKFAESIQLLKEAHKLDPSTVLYPYEIGYALYAQKKYKECAKQLEGLLKYKDVHGRVYQLLGNCYDNLGKSEKAIETYNKGLELFPNEGILYLESGIMQMGKKEFNKALNYFEAGIQADPKFPSNYYWAAKLFCSSSEEVWGMIYGELFMNMERNTKRTAEISKILYDTYVSEIKIENDTSMTVSFSQQNTITVDDLSDPENLKLPFPLMAYEPTLLMAVALVGKVDINSLNVIRTLFVENYFQMGHGKKYPNQLFDWQKEIKEAGHMEAYNYWILMMGDEDGFDVWREANEEKWDAFFKWFGEHKMPVDDNHKFHRTQY
ncbi:MAG: tetratricopeptide repeat protein [Bacteroidia bacterium]|nr:tetratricopeptide repeat protein [Bacteroidia bacterium]